METISEYLSSKGINESDLVLDGTMKNHKTETFKGWYIGDTLEGGKKRFTIEDWRTKERRSFSEGFTNSKEDKEALEEIRKKFEAEKYALQKEKIRQVKIGLNTFKNTNKDHTGFSEYLAKKKINSAFGAMIVRSMAQGSDVIIPMQDEHGEIWNYQTIQEDSFKTFQPGARVDGLYFELIPEEKVDESLILICEGFATACSVQMAIPYSRVICAFSSGNLPSVADKIRRINNYARIVICGDDDKHLKENAGKIAAEKAALISCGSTVYPRFI